MDTVFLILAWVCVLIGLVGIFLPMVPGVPLLWIGMLIVGWVSGFEALSGTVLVVTGILAAFTQAIDYIAGTMGAKLFGATPLGTVGAFIGMIVGLFMLGPLGVIVGPFFGALAAELMGGRNERQAFRAGIGTLFGFLGGTFVQMLVGFVLFGYFIVGFIRFF